MAQHRRTYSPERSRRRSRQVQQSVVGTHVSRGRGTVSRDRTYAQGVARKASARRVLAVIIAVIIVVGLALGAGFLAFRGSIGSEMALRNSNAKDALVATKTGEVHYVLLTAELGSVAAPLDNGGPDIIMLARVDSQNGKLALVNLPAATQVTTDNKSESLASVAQAGDAALIQAVSQFAKVDISHYIKLTEPGFIGLVDGLGGVEVDVDQIIDDPHAGDIYLDAGNQTLDGAKAQVYLRATNLKMGETDQYAHQLKFATLLIQKLFSKDGNFTTRLEPVASNLQTDVSLADFESTDKWLGGVSASDIVTANLPGYITEVTNVEGSERGRYIATSADLVQLLEDIADGKDVSKNALDNVGTVSPSSFTVEVRNGTDITGAAQVTADKLAAAGFNIAATGNADQPIYNETLVVYKGTEGPARAKTVINTLGLGRAVEGDVYYKFDTDVLVIIGGDYKPTA